MVQYNDWKGTAALDNSDDYDALHKLTGADKDEWWIVGVEVYGGYDSSGGAVLAVRRSLIPDYDAMVRWGQTDRPLPVSRFDLPYGTSGQELLSNFKRWSIHATPGAVSDGGVTFEVEETTPVHTDPES
jgi:hypothetical protein